MMDELSQKMFNEIVAKDPHELNKEERLFLRARRSYLRGYDKEKFQELVDSKEPEEVQAEEGEKLDRSALKKEAKSLGITVTSELTTPQIKAMIDNARFDKEEAEDARREKEEADRLAAENANKLDEEKATKNGHKGNFESDEEKALKAKGKASYPLENN